MKMVGGKISFSKTKNILWGFKNAAPDSNNAVICSKV